MRHFYATFWWDILTKHFDETFWWGILIRHFYDTFWWDIWWKMLMRHFDTLWRNLMVCNDLWWPLIWWRCLCENLMTVLSVSLYYTAGWVFKTQCYQSQLKEYFFFNLENILFMEGFFQTSHWQWDHLSSWPIHPPQKNLLNWKKKKSPVFWQTRKHLISTFLSMFKGKAI